MAGRRVLLYPSLGDSPTIFVNIINAKTGRPHMFQMLVDTGASRSRLRRATASQGSAELAEFMEMR